MSRQNNSEFVNEVFIVAVISIKSVLCCFSFFHCFF